MLDKGDLYTLGRLPYGDYTSLRPFFDALPADPYAHERLRSRRYSRLKLTKGALEIRRHKEFMQTSEINDYLGDVEREYEELANTLLDNPVFQEIFKVFQTHTGLSQDSVIEVHQIRFHCRKNVKEPAPEGVHQDGFDYVGVFIVAAENHTGGDMMLFNAPDQNPFYREVLRPGEFVVFNDRALFHNAAPLIPKDPTKEGYWDIFVLTGNKMP